MNLQKQSRRMRVALIHYRDDASAGGSLRVGETLANNLDPDRVDAHLVFAYGGPGPVSKKARVACHFLRAKGPKHFEAWIAARRFIRRLNPDILHFMDGVVWLQCALLGTSYPRLLHIHGRYLISCMKLKGRMLCRVLARMVDGQICITEGAKRTLQQLRWGRPDRIWTVYNAVDVKFFQDLPSRSFARAQLGLPRGVKIISMICLLVRYRGCDDAIRLLARLREDWHLVFCGDGPYRSELQALVRMMGLDARVHFLGLMDDVRLVYASSDAYLLAARHDSFGLSVCQAMAAGVPVFALGGDGEYREPEYPLITPENAVVVERSNPLDYDAPEAPQVLDELAKRIWDLDEHPDRYRLMAERAAAWVAEHFNATIQANAIAELYLRITGR